MWLSKKKGRAELRFELKYRKIIETITKALDSDVEVMLAPLSGEYFIVDKNNDVSIVISDFSIRMFDKGCPYEIVCPASLTGDLIAKTKAKAESQAEAKADKLRKELFKNEIELLDRINNLYTKKD